MPSHDAPAASPDLGPKTEPSSVVEPPVAKAEVGETKERKTRPKKRPSKKRALLASKAKSKVDNTDGQKPKVVDVVDCITPAEQNKLSGKSEPKKRGRPAKKGKGKGKQAGKAKVKNEKNKGKGGKKNTDNEEQQQPARRNNKNRSKHEEAGADGSDDACKRVKKAKTKAGQPSSSHEAVVCEDKPKRTKRKVDEASLDEKDGSVKSKHPVPTKRVRVKSSPTKKIDPSSSSKSKASKADADAKKSASKSKNARKSAAYRRAIKKAKDEGLDEEECKAAGRKVF